MLTPPYAILPDTPVKTEKEARIERLFSSIAHRYDLINSVLSISRHKAWRRFAVAKSGIGPGGRAVDVCCGTGDFAFELARVVGPTGAVVAVDFSDSMLDVARDKAERLGLAQVEFLRANACDLPFGDGEFDCATVGFGLRNVDCVDTAIREMARVTRSGGKVVSLEIVGIRSSIAVPIWRLFFDVIAPLAACVLRGRREAYEYLSRSVREFISASELTTRFTKCGLAEVSCYNLALGAVCVHVGTKT
ncbi:MAG: bifunctional demethylmenaquinone methyltransferase/2-methoxy-6-polyprenyl-1,4-benzoquinol methylase UbiE [Armatimonadetes bacterium]|nr:bifunctional demethylmenaquinone methyltransferase/2-methoxy-6-polyprenyl-1,4-benzoquinol methylase UbiE [Armatimonadota bacterium]